MAPLWSAGPVWTGRGTERWHRGSSSTTRRLRLPKACRRGPRRERLVQPPAHRGFGGSDATSGIVFVLGAQRLRGSRCSRRLQEWNVQRSRGQLERRDDLRIQVRRDGSDGRNSVPDQAGGPRGLVQPSGRVRGQGTDEMSGISPVHHRATRARIARRRPSQGTCFDRAGNRGTRSFALKYDATGPETTATPTARLTRTAGSTKRSRSASPEPTQSRHRILLPARELHGAGLRRGGLGGICLDKAGNVGLASLSVSYDATAPVVSAPSPPVRRTPTAGTTASSSSASRQRRHLGIGSCTQASYAGPDAAAASVSGSCQDHAGNAGESLPFRSASTRPHRRSASSE